MIVVTKIETLKTEKDFIEIAHHIGPSGFYGNPSSCDEAKITSEIIRGRRFTGGRLGSGDVIIGWSDEVEQAIGIPLETIDNMASAIDELNEEIKVYRVMMNKAQSYIDEVEKMSLLSHIKYWWLNRDQPR